MDLNEAKRILEQGWEDELIKALEWAIAEIERRDAGVAGIADTWQEVKQHFAETSSRVEEVG